jgi:hypothetical protein
MIRENVIQRTLVCRETLRAQVVTRSNAFSYLIPTIQTTFEIYLVLSDISASIEYKLCKIAIGKLFSFV